MTNGRKKMRVPIIKKAVEKGTFIKRTEKAYAIFLVHTRDWRRDDMTHVTKNV